MMTKVLIAAGLLFGTGVLTGLGVGRLNQLSVPPAPEATTLAPTTNHLAGERASRGNRTNNWRLPTMRPPGAGRLEQFKRSLHEIELDTLQRERIENHFRESQERLKALLKPLQPEALRELRTLRQQILAELTSEQRAQFERQNTERVPRPRAAERRD